MKTHWPSGKPKGWSSPRSSLFGVGYLHKRSKQLATGSIELTKLCLPKKLDEGERGALVRPQIDFNNRPDGYVTVSTGEGFDADLMRSTLLFFERIVNPSNSAIGTKSLLDEIPDYQGIEEPRSTVSGSIMNDPVSLVTAATFEQLESREPGLWSLSRSVQQSQLPRGLMTELSGFKLRLENALPIPDRQVPYDEVLHFRSRREPELQALRSHLEGVALQVARDGFGGLAETRAYEDFIQAIESHARVSREANFLKRMTNLEVTFDWTSAGASLLAAGAAFTGQFGIAALAGLNALVSSVSIESSYGLKGERDKPRAFDYVFQAKDEL